MEVKVVGSGEVKHDVKHMQVTLDISYTDEELKHFRDWIGLPRGINDPLNTDIGLDFAELICKAVAAKL